MPYDDPPMLRCLAARAELAGDQLRRSSATTAGQMASVQWHGPAARIFDRELGALLLLVRRTADDLDQVAAALRRQLARSASP